MYRTLQQTLLARIHALLATKYSLDTAELGGPIAMEQPPSIALGELALPLAFELAKRLRKAPRVIAAELAEALNADLPAGIRSVEVAGAGYLNVRLDRAALVARVARDEHADLGGPGFRLIEHTSINPNKAAHIGHLRNAILGDTFARLLRSDDFKSGFDIGVQNYIDNTGVQVADVVVGLTELLHLDLTGVREKLTEIYETNELVDYFCWDLYARVSQWYTEPGQAAEELARRKKVRVDTLHSLEAGSNETAEIAELISTSVLRRHLETMQRLGIEYDFLPRESEILSLHFWDAARQVMIDRGVLYQETAGKNAGCWVMRRAGTEGTTATGEPDEDAKVIVRSNGTVTYVGKDIAYHLWKFGLLPGKDFFYERFHEYPADPNAIEIGRRDTRTCWASTGLPAANDSTHPVFAKADAIYNVIDSSQSDPQGNVVAALRGMGYTDAADRYTHFSYEKVALTPRCALELGYTIADEDKGRPFIEVSGRKGQGVKADDLLDKLIAAAGAQVNERNPELDPEARDLIARQIAIGALRYFMLRFNRNTVIAFDFKDALSFEGETGPYVQYSIVRAANIFRKAGTTEAEALAALPSPEALAPLLESAAPVESAAAGKGSTSAAHGLEAAPDGTVIWETWLAVSRLTAVLDQTISAAEPATLTRYAFTLAQQFNNFYHRHHILNETDPVRRALLLATAAAARRELVRALAYLGIEAPEVM